MSEARRGIPVSSGGEPVGIQTNPSKRTAAKAVDVSDEELVKAHKEAQALYDARQSVRTRAVKKGDAPEHHTKTAEGERLAAEYKAVQAAKKRAERAAADMRGEFSFDASAADEPKPARRNAPPAAEAAPARPGRPRPQLIPRSPEAGAGADQALRDKAADELLEIAKSPTFVELFGSPAAENAPDARATLPPVRRTAPRRQPENLPAASEVQFQNPSPTESTEDTLQLEESDEEKPARSESNVFQKIRDSRWSKPVVALGALVAGLFGLSRMPDRNAAAPGVPESAMSIPSGEPAAAEAPGTVAVDEASAEIVAPSVAVPAPEAAAPTIESHTTKATGHRERVSRPSSAADDLRLRLDNFAAGQEFIHGISGLDLNDPSTLDLNVSAPKKSTAHKAPRAESHAKTTGDLKAKLETYAEGNQLIKDMGKAADSAETSSKIEQSKASLETWMAGQRMLSKAKNFDGVHPDTFKLQRKDAMRLAEGDPKDLLEAMSIWAKFPGEAAYKKLKAEERLELLKQQILNVRLANSIISGTNRDAIESQLKATELKLKDLAEKEQGFINEGDEEEIHLDDEIES